MFDKLKDKKSVLLFSGGYDSTLLLSLLREQNVPCDILQLGRHWWTKEQIDYADVLAKEWNLKMFAYPPMQSYLVQKDKQTALVSEYAIGSSYIPVIRDIIGGTRCLADIATEKQLFIQPMEWNLFVVGSRQEDTHWLLEDVIPGKEWMHADKEFYAPLYDWTKEEVVDALKARGLYREYTEVENTGNLSFCDKCITTDKMSVWCPKDETEIPSVPVPLTRLRDFA